MGYKGAKFSYFHQTTGYLCETDPFALAVRTTSPHIFQIITPRKLPNLASCQAVILKCVMQHRLKQAAGFSLECCEAGRAADSAR